MIRCDHVQFFYMIYLNCLVLLFLVAVLGQSGLDKVLDYAGNKAYFQGQFANSPLKPLVGILFPLVLLLEVGTAVLSLLALATLCLQGNHDLGIYACALGSLTFIALIFGQRMAKDYGGAAGIVPYLAVTLLGLFALSQA